MRRRDARLVARPRGLVFFAIRNSLPSELSLLNRVAVIQVS
jgi:hypothetical protein